MQYVFFAGILTLIILTVMSVVRNATKLRAQLKDSIGKKPVRKDYDLDSMASYHFFAKNFTDTTRYIDDITWNDLDMDKVYKRINTCLTSVGEEYLYHTLHVPKFNEEELGNREKLIEYLDSHSEERSKIQLYLAKLGKLDYNSIASYIFDADSKRLRHSFIYTILAIVPLLCAASMIIDLPMGIVLLVISLIINGIVYMRVKLKLESGLATIQYFGGMLWSCKKILKTGEEELNGLTCGLRSAYAVFKRYGGKLSRMLHKSGNELDFLVDYLRLITFGDIRKYNSVIGQMVKERAALRALYEELGTIDAALAVLCFRKSLEACCKPEFTCDNKIVFNGLYHPLLEGAVKNNGQIAKNSIVTGPNASGKSTFIKALAVNSILAQTINTCTADRFIIRRSLVMTSMAVRDDLEKGESYFITEIKSLKRILDKIEELPCLCFIDEILRGTNTIERIAASSAILKHLHGKDCLCMIASHDIELTAIMEKLYSNYHFTESVGQDGVIFDFLLRQGSAASTNAIKLLGVLGYDRSIVERAQDNADHYLSAKSWDSIG